MHSQKLFILATTENETDVKVLNIYDGDLFTLDTILAGFKKNLCNDITKLTIMGNNAYIDVLDENGSIKKTYSITSELAFIKKVH